MRIWLFRLVLVLPVVGLLTLLELGARINAYYSDSALQRGLAKVGGVSASGDLSLQHIIRWHENPKLVYELIPKLHGEFRGHTLSINTRGFRGPPVDARKAPNGYRVIGVGDSVMFGWGVADDEVYLAQLARLLSERMPERVVDWVNSAVPGYNTVNEVETLERKLLELHPDLVIVDYVRNDLHVPGFLRKPQSYFTIRQSFLARWVRNRLEGLHMPDHALERPPDAFRRESFLGQEELIPEEYRELIGIDAFRTAATRLRELVDQHGFRVIVFAHYGFDPDPLAVLDELGLEAVDGYPRVRAYLREEGLEDYLGSPLTVSTKDSHPSALHHRLIAQQLADHLVPVGDAGVQIYPTNGMRVDWSGPR